jgi:hypothetical protein
MISDDLFTPVSNAGIHSQCSTREYAFSLTALSSLRTCRALAQNHSMNDSSFVSTVVDLPGTAELLISRPQQRLYDLSKHNIGVRISANSGKRASGVPVSSVKTGVLPVVRKPFHHIGGSTRRSERRASITEPSSTSYNQRVLTVPVGGGQTIFALHPAGIVFYRVATVSPVRR